MKRIFIISITAFCLLYLYGCGRNKDKASSENWSTESDWPDSAYVPPKSSSPDLEMNSIKGFGNAGSSDAEEIKDEAARQKAMSTLLESKKEINMAMDAISDSLSKSGLSEDVKLLYQKTLRVLESSTALANKQIGQIIVSDLRKNENKLKVIVMQMRSSQKELGDMIARLDKISGLIQSATNIVQSLTPIPPAVPVKVQPKSTAK